MEKYLFTDGTNVIREVESERELQALIDAAADPGKVRIWMFNTSEWVTLTAFQKSRKLFIGKETEVPQAKNEKTRPIQAVSNPRSGHLKKAAFMVTGCVAIFLIYNFTKVTWSKADSVEINAIRPANTPVLNLDSLIQAIEWSRGGKLDKVTYTNLRIRNSWPDRLELKINADRDTSTAGGTRFYNLHVSIDNSTGYLVNEAVIEFHIWNEGNRMHTDTLMFERLGYANLSQRNVEGVFSGDSLSVSFLSIRAPSFNFCYSAEKQSNYGNLNDRWFCRD